MLFARMDAALHLANSQKVTTDCARAKGRSAAHVLHLERRPLNEPCKMPSSVKLQSWFTGGGMPGLPTDFIPICHRSEVDLETLKSVPRTGGFQPRDHMSADQ